MNPFWESVRMSVCRKCIDGDSKGNCRLPHDELCALREYFPALLESLSAVKSHSLEPYVETLRAHICTQCSYQTGSGTCRRRDTMECALDRYFPLIVEKVQAMKVFVE